MPVDSEIESKAKHMRAPLILIEGLDRTGKTTQTSLLVSRLQQQHGHNKVELLKFPDRTTNIGQLINRYLTDKTFELSDEAAHLLFSANRWELAETIKQKLQNGVIVILDRYVYSGVAYSAAKGLSWDWCYGCDMGLPRPDLTLFLSLKDNSDRGGFGDERYEVSEFQQEVKKQFEKFVKRAEKGWVTLEVDGLGIEEVQEKVWGLVVGLIDGGVEKDVELFD